MEIVSQSGSGKNFAGLIQIEEGKIRSHVDQVVRDAAAFGQSLPLPADDVFSNLLDLSLTCATFGWVAKTPLKDGVRRAVLYYREHGLDRAYSHLRGFGD